MAQTIWKFPLSGGPGDMFALELPKNAKVLTCQLQNSRPCMWVVCNPLEEKERRLFTVVGTGWAIDCDAKQWNYISTWQEGPFVWHLFEML